MSELVLITDSELSSIGEAEAILSDAGLGVRHAASASAADLIAAGREASALLVQWAPVTAEVLEGLPRCRLVARLGIGYEMIDVAEATRLGIAVANVPDYCVDEVALHTIAMALGCQRGLPMLDFSVRAGRWEPGEVANVERAGRCRATVVGFGRIGRRVASGMAALGFQVLVADPYVGHETVARFGLTPVELDEGLEQADLLLLHVPLSPETRHLLDRDAIRRLPNGAIVVNTCRGGLVDEAALAVALHDGHLGAAALDVFAEEPLGEDSPLRSSPNTVLTPHSAWYSRTALLELPRRAARTIVAFLADEEVSAIVNPGYHASVRERPA